MLLAAMMLASNRARHNQIAIGDLRLAAAIAFADPVCIAAPTEGRPDNSELAKFLAKKIDLSHE